MTSLPDENCLPINPVNTGINGLFRIYVPDVEKMKTWLIAAMFESDRLVTVYKE